MSQICTTHWGPETQPEVNKNMSITRSNKQHKKGTWTWFIDGPSGHVKRFVKEINPGQSLKFQRSINYLNWCLCGETLVAFVCVWLREHQVRVHCERIKTINSLINIKRPGWNITTTSDEPLSSKLVSHLTVFKVKLRSLLSWRLFLFWVKAWPLCWIRCHNLLEHCFVIIFDLT